MTPVVRTRLAVQWHSLARRNKQSTQLTIHCILQLHGLALMLAFPLYLHFTCQSCFLKSWQGCFGHFSWQNAHFNIHSHFIRHPGSGTVELAVDVYRQVGGLGRLYKLHASPKSCWQGRLPFETSHWVRHWSWLVMERDPGNIKKTHWHNPCRFDPNVDRPLNRADWPKLSLRWQWKERVNDRLPCQCPCCQDQYKWQHLNPICMMAHL